MLLLLTFILQSRDQHSRCHLYPFYRIFQIDGWLCISSLQHFSDRPKPLLCVTVLQAMRLMGLSPWLSVKLSLSKNSLFPVEFSLRLSITTLSCMEEWRRTSLILNLRARWRCMVSFKARPVYSWRKSAWRLDALENGLFSLVLVETQFIGRPARRLVSTPTETYRLLGFH